MSTAALRAGLGLTAATVALLAGNAFAVGAPTFPTSQVWFHCNGQTKVNNANEFLGDDLPGWNATKPTQSVSAGAGCGTADPSLLVSTVEDTNQADAAWQGTIVGNINSITVEAYNAYVGSARGAVTAFGVEPRLFVDGEKIAFPTTPPLIVKPVPTSTGLAEKVTFTLTGLGITEDLDEDGVPDPGPGTTERKVTLQLQNVYVNSTVVGAWLFDTTEVPAGLVVNPAKPEVARLARVTG